MGDDAPPSNFPGFPCVLKIGPCHAGFGKMKVTNKTVWSDFKTCAQVDDKDYISAEPFITWDYELRLQKLGPHIKAFKKFNVDPSQWKSNCGGIHLYDTPVTPMMKLWVDEASKVFGGLDILSLDVLHDS